MDTGATRDPRRLQPTVTAEPLVRLTEDTTEPHGRRTEQDGCATSGWDGATSRPGVCGHREQRNTDW